MFVGWNGILTLDYRVCLFVVFLLSSLKDPSVMKKVFLFFIFFIMSLNRFSSLVAIHSQ